MAAVDDSSRKKSPVEKPIIGLVGGIGAGKSLAAALFAKKPGVQMIDADAIGHAALREPAIRSQVIERWGPSVLDGEGQVDRRKVGAIVFADPAERAALQEMVFRWIDQRIREQIAAAEADPAKRLIVLDAAIMMETGWDEVCSRIVFIDAPSEVRLARLIEKRGWTADQLSARERAQLKVDQKRGRADDVMMNDGSPADLARQIDRWFETSPLFA